MHSILSCSLPCPVESQSLARTAEYCHVLTCPQILDSSPFVFSVKVEVLCYRSQQEYVVDAARAWSSSKPIAENAVIPHAFETL